MKQVVARVQCPSCRESGRDNEGNNLVQYSDGGAYCFSCGYFIADRNYSDKGQQQATNENEREYKMPEHTLETILAKRNIRPEVFKKYGVTLVSKEDALSVRVPITDSNGQEVGAQYREVDISNGKLTREMRTTKGSKLKTPFFGINTITKSTTTVLITEGWTDALRAATALYGRSDISVLGLCGATFAKRAAAYAVRFLQDKKVVLAFDNDDAGDKAKETFMKAVTETDPDSVIYKLLIPQKHKDVSEWLDAGALDFPAHVDTAAPVFNSNLLTSQDIGERLAVFLDVLKMQDYIRINFSATLDRCVKLMPGKLIGVMGDSGQGKSTLVEHFMLEAITQKKRVFCVSAEMSAEEVALKLMRVVRSEPLHDPNYLLSLDKSYFEEVVDETTRVLSWLTMVDNFGKMSVDRLDSYLLELSAAGMKPDLVAVDHLLAISENLEANTLQQTCKDLKAIARKHQVCVVLVSHIKKPQNQNRRTIYRPMMSDAYGSQGLTMYADVILTAAKDPIKKLTFIETVKQERLIGDYCDITLSFVDWQLSEIEAKEDKKRDYEAEADTDDEDDVY